MRYKTLAASLILGLAALAAAPVFAAPLTSEITYQGRLLDNGGLASGTYDFEFQLWNDSAAGAQVGSTITKTGATVAGGLFTEKLDFGSPAYNGQALWLQINVKKTSEGSYTPLAPRTSVTAGPYSLTASLATAVVDDAIDSDAIADGAVDRPHFVTGLRNSLDASDGNPQNAVFTDADGRVGIGNTSPAAKLHVTDTATVPAMIESSSTTGSWLRLKNTSTDGNEWNLISTGSGNSEGVGKLLFRDTDTAVMSLNPNGFIGMGTFSPTSKLHVSDGNSVPVLVETNNVNGSWLRLLNTSVGGSEWNFVSTGSSNGEGPGKLLLRDNDSNAMTIIPDGSVGIGTSAPVSKLHVSDDSINQLRVDGPNTAGTWARIRNTSAGGNEWAIASTGSSNGEGVGKLLFKNDTSNTTAMTMIPNGSVGVGTSTPTSRMHITSASADALMAHSGSTTGTWARVSNTSVGGDEWALVSTGSGSAMGAGKLLFRDVDTSIDTMTLAPTGLVGVGTSSPSAKLHVVDGGASSLQVDSSNNTGTWGRFKNTSAGGKEWSIISTGSSNGEGTGKLLINNSTDGANAMTVASNGSVGMGINSPTAKLHVATAGTFPFQVDSSSTVGTWARFKNTSPGGNEWAIVSTANGNGEGAGRLLFRNITSSKNGVQIESNGDVQVPVLEVTGGADIAEPFDIAGEKPLPGMVVCINPENPGGLRVATAAYDRTVAGIISGAGGVNPGMMLKHEGTVADGDLPVALTGRVYCYVDADAAGPIAVGDMLTTSSTPGHAMRVTEFDRAHGAVIGKAMTELKTGKGLVLVLVNLQ